MKNLKKYRVVYSFARDVKLATLDHKLPETIELQEDLANLFRYLGIVLEEIK